MNELSSKKYIYRAEIAWFGCTDVKKYSAK